MHNTYYKMEINKINVNGTSYDIQDSRVGTTVPSNAVFTDTTYTAGTGISISNGQISVDSSVYTTSNAPTDTNTTYSLTINGTTNGDSNGTSLGTVYAPTTTGTSGQVWKSNGSGGEWGTISANVNYPDVGYTVTTKTNSSSSITNLDATVADECIITTSSSISSLRFTAGKAPAIGHSYHVIIKSNGTTERSITVSAGRVSDSTVTGSYMYYICPTTDGISSKTKWVSTLSTNASSCSYAEIDFLRLDETTIYVRGV